MPTKALTAGSIWQTLSKINVNEFTESKGGLTYLSWSHAFRLMMENYPELTIKWMGTTDSNGVTRDVTYYEGGTATVSCSVTVGDVTREMWLPVMDFRMKSIPHPSSRDISDAKMRCMVKAFALLGLGIYIYSGDGLPYEDVPAPKAKAQPKAKPKAKAKALEADHTRLTEEAMLKLCGLLDACEAHGGVDAKTLNAAAAVVEARGPLERAEAAIAHLEKEISRV
jgi:hypothetical protein